jgi:MFS family permease
MIGPTRFQGWSVAWAAFVIALFGFGIGFYGPGVILQTLHASRGWSVAAISTAITTHFLVGAAIVAYLPEVHRALGIAHATILGAVLSALGLLAWSIATMPWQLFAVALVSGGGWALTSGAAINALIAPWFDRDRPKALSHAFNGASIGGVTFTPLLVWLIARLGFPAAAAILGLAMVVAVAPLAHRYLRHGPADLGLLPDGKSPPSATHRSATRLPSSRAALMRSRNFATVSAAFALALFAQVGLLAHLLARLSPALGTNGAAMAVSLTTAAAVIGRYLLGWLIGDTNRRHAACANFAVQATGTLLLCTGNGAPVLLLGCVLFGLGVGNVAALPALIAQKEFDPIDVGTVVALMIAINQAAFALAPAFFGALRDFSSNYALSFTLAGALQLGAAALLLGGRVRGANRRTLGLD